MAKQYIQVSLLFSKKIFIISTLKLLPFSAKEQKHVFHFEFKLKGSFILISKNKT